MGFVPNSMLTMAHRPDLLRAFGSLARATRTGTVPPALKEMVALVASTAAGCRYCQTRSAANSEHAGGDPAKIAQVCSYDTSEPFSDTERAALRLAHHAALVPNQATDEDFAELRRHFNDGEIVGMVALYGFLNPWNDTMATEVEDHPLPVAGQALHSIDWQAGEARLDSPGHRLDADSHFSALARDQRADLHLPSYNPVAEPRVGNREPRARPSTCKRRPDHGA